MSMVVREIFVFGTTNDGFEVFPSRFHKEFTKLDKDREKTFIKQSKLNRENVLIQYQIGDLISYNNRPGHHFGYCLVTAGRVDKAKYHEAIRYLDGIHTKAFQSHLKIIESGKYKYRRFSEIPKLEAVLNSVKTAINSDTPDFFINANGLNTDFIAEPFDHTKNKKGKKVSRANDSEIVLADNIIPGPNKKVKKSALGWKDGLLVLALICGVSSLYFSWNNHKKLNYLAKAISIKAAKQSSGNEKPMIVAKGLTKEKFNNGKKQIFFDHNAAFKTNKLNGKVINKDNFIKLIVELTNPQLRVDKNFILKSNSEDLKLVEEELENSAEATFEDVFKKISSSGILIYQED